MMVAVFNINIVTTSDPLPEAIEREELKLEDIFRTEIIEIPPAPPRPTAPVTVPDDAVLDDDLLPIDAVIHDYQFDVPPPEEEETYEPDFFEAVEIMPELQGGLQALHNELEYPAMERRAGIEGRVSIQFVVDENGKVTQPEVIRSSGNQNIDAEAVRALSQMTFSPGIQSGRIVPVRMIHTITFRLN